MLATISLCSGGVQAMGDWLTAEQAIAYAHLTTEALALALPGITLPVSEPETAPQLHAAGTSFAGLPAALAVVRVSSGSALEVLSLVVAEPFRRLGLAGNLLAWLRCEARRLRCSTLMVCFPHDHASTAAMERLTPASQGWSHEPGLRLVHLNRGGLQALLDRVVPMVEPWQRSSRFRSVAWSELSAQQRQQLTTVEQVPRWALPDHVALGDSVSELDAAVSQVLLDQETPTGWLLANRVGASRVRVTAWWVRPALQGKGLALLLLKPAIAVALDCQPAYTACSFGIAADNQSMLRLSKRHLEPFSYQQQTTTKASQRSCVNQLASNGCCSC